MPYPKGECLGHGRRRNGGWPSMAALLMATLSLGACASYASVERKAEIGRAALEAALSESETISVRTFHGGVYVKGNVELLPGEYCSDLLAVWDTGPTERWRENDRHGVVPRTCAPYSAIRSAVPRDVRHCEFSDCLWMRGFTGG